MRLAKCFSLAVPLGLLVGCASSQLHSIDHFGAADLERVEADLKNLDEMRYMLIGTCNDANREERAERIKEEIVAVIREYTAKTDRDIHGDIILVGRDSCDGERFFERNYRAVQKMLAKSRKVVRQLK